MMTGFKLGWAAFVVFASTGVGMSAGVAYGKPTASCEAQPGATRLADQYGRVYKAHGEVLACARGSRRSHVLVPRNVIGPDQERNVYYSLTETQLQGRFVAWLYYDGSPSGTLQVLKVLDLRTGGVRTVDEHAADGGPRIVEFVLNDRGVAVYRYTGLGDLIAEDNPKTGRATLAQSLTNNEFSALGMSLSGDYAYWLDNGKYTGAKIS